MEADKASISLSLALGHSGDTTTGVGGSCGVCMES